MVIISWEEEKKKFVFFSSKKGKTIKNTKQISLYDDWCGLNEMEYHQLFECCIYFMDKYITENPLQIANKYFLDLLVGEIVSWGSKI